MKLNSELKAKLVRALAEGLGDMPVQGGYALTAEAYEFLEKIDQILPKNHSPRDASNSERAPRAYLASIIDDKPVADFLEDHISRKLQAESGDTRISLLGPPRPLNECVSNLDPEQFAAEAIARIEELPHRYTFTLPLSSSFSGFLTPNQNELVINQQLRLVRVTPEFETKFPGSLPVPLAKLADAFSGFNYYGLMVGDIALQIDAEGFASRYGETATVTEAMLLVKAFFFGLCTALSLVNRRYLLPSDARQDALFIHRTDQPALIGRRPFDIAAGHFMRALELAPKVFELNEASRILHIRSAMTDIGKCLDAGDEAKRMRLACRWFFDSSASSDEVTAFVQGMIVLETLLGRMDSEEREQLGLGELLRNRCAYLLGNSRQEREDILTRFPAIYRVRSAIVHRGLPRLSSSERQLLFDLRWYCARVIRAEGKLLR